MEYQRSKVAKPLESSYLYLGSNEKGVILSSVRLQTEYTTLLCPLVLYSSLVLGLKALLPSFYS